jgi:hypothetical protein
MTAERTDQNLKSEVRSIQKKKGGLQGPHFFASIYDSGTTTSVILFELKSLAPTKDNTRNGQAPFFKEKGTVPLLL